jgi:hypothetical protein
LAACFSGLDVRFGRAVRDSLVAAGAIYLLLVVGIGAHEGPLRLAHFFAEDMQGNGNLQRMLLLGFALDSSAWIAPITGVVSFLARTGTAVVRTALDAARAQGRTTVAVEIHDTTNRQDGGGRTNG